MIVGREGVGDVLLSVWKIPEDLGRCAALSLDDSPRPGVRARSKLLVSASLPSFSISVNTFANKVMAADAVKAEAAVAKQSNLRCVASTGEKYRCTVDDAHPGWADQVHGHATRADKDESNCFRHALLSADGTAVVTYNEDLILRTFAV
jgi:hypothetical protein